MSAEKVRVGDVLQLDRVPINPSLDGAHVAIGVRSFGKGVFHYEPKTGDQLGKLRFFQAVPHRLVLSNIKAWEGAIAISCEVEEGCIASSRFLFYAADSTRADVRWLRWYLLSEPGLGLIQQASPGSADRNRTLSIERFEALEIPLPPIDDQRRAAARLDAWHARSARVEARLVATSPTRLIGHLPSMIDAILSGATGVAAVGDLVDFVGDTVHPGDDPSPADSFVGLQHIESHTGRRVGSAPLGGEMGRKFRFRPGDIVYGYLRPYLNKVWLSDRHGLCSVDQYVLRPKPGTDARLLAYALRSETVLSAGKDLTHNLQLPRLRSSLLAHIEVPVASQALLPRLDRLNASVTALAAKRQRQIAAAAALLPAALNREFTGVV